MTFKWSAKLIGYSAGFDPNQFLREWQGPAVEVWRVGDSIAGSIRKRQDSGCKLRITCESTNAMIGDVLEASLHYLSAWSKTVHNLGGRVELSLVVRTDGADFPALSFSDSLIGQLAAAEASLDVDIIPSL